MHVQAHGGGYMEKPWSLLDRFNLYRSTDKHSTGPLDAPFETFAAFVEAFVEGRVVTGEFETKFVDSDAGERINRRERRDGLRLRVATLLDLARPAILAPACPWPEALGDEIGVYLKEVGLWPSPTLILGQWRLKDAVLLDE